MKEVRTYDLGPERFRPVEIEIRDKRKLLEQKKGTTK